jgi:anti-sigma B factor antagonist
VPTVDHLSYVVSTPFRVDVHAERDIVRVAPVGELDCATVAQLQAQISELRASGFDHLVLDLRGLTFMDSSGVALILDEHLSARRDGREFVLINGAPPIQRVLKVCLGDDVLRFRSASSLRSPAREGSAAAWDTPALPLAMRRYLGGLRHEARPRRHLTT